MIYLIEFLLFLAPFAGFGLWRKLNPNSEVPGVVVWLMLAGVGLGLAGAVFYARSVRIEAHDTYVPAQLGPDGRIVPGRGVPPR